MGRLRRTQVPDVPPDNRLIIADRDEGRRIDNYLMRVLKDVPRAHIYKMLRSGQIRVNGGRARPERRLGTGDEVRLPPGIAGTGTAEAPRLSARVLADIERAIVYEAADCLVVDKPSGIAVHKGTGLPWGLIDVLRALRPDAECVELVHRLDRETSGLLVVAKSHAALAALGDLTRAHALNKRYLALVAGSWPRGRRLVRGRLAAERSAGEKHIVVAQNGRAAEAWFSRVRAFAVATLVEVELVTGRTHQIRVQAAAEGHPLAGDERYGDPAFNEAMAELGLRRLFLHASTLSFELFGRPVAVTSALPGPLSDTLARLAPAGNG